MPTHWFARPCAVRPTLSAQLDQRLADTIAVTQGVIAAALEQRRLRAGRTVPEMDHLRAVLSRLVGLSAKLDRTATR